MKKSTKTALRLALILIAAGLVCGGLVFALNGFAFPPLDGVVRAEKETVILDSFQNVQIDTTSENVRLVTAKDGVCRIVYTGAESTAPSVLVQDGLLHISAEKYIPWYKDIRIFGRNTELTCYLPERHYHTVSVQNTSGDVLCDVAAYFAAGEFHTTSGRLTVAGEFQNLTANSTSGDILVENSHSAKLCALKSTSGEISTQYSSFRVLHTKSTSGSVQFSQTRITEKLEAKVTSGDIRLEAVDAQELYMQTSSGSVTGTLTSPKIFIAETNSGLVNVPDTKEGGFCEVHTSSGNIHLEIEK